MFSKSTPSIKVQVNCYPVKHEVWKTIDTLKDTTLDSISVFVFNMRNFIEQIPELIKILNDQELIKSERYFQENDKNHFIISRALLKLLIAKYAPLDPQDICFEEGFNKKPHVLGNERLHFNVSHSHDWTAIAVADTNIGIDLEEIKNEFNFRDILPVSFNEEERNFIGNNERSAFLFYELWTRKEALAKATAKGIDDDFSALPSLAGEHQSDSGSVGSGNAWSVKSFFFNSNKIISLAHLLDEVRSINFYEINDKFLNK